MKARDLPFAMVQPEVGQFITPLGGDKYDVTLQLVRTNHADNKVYPTAPYVNGQQLPGAVMLSGDMLFTFRSVHLPKQGNMSLGLRDLANSNNSVSTTIPRQKFNQTLASLNQTPTMPVSSPAVSAKLKVLVSYPKKNKVHHVRLYLLDEQGAGRTGKVEITAGQDFKVNGQRQSGHYELAVQNSEGEHFTLQPTSGDEAFVFTDIERGISVKKILLG